MTNDKKIKRPKGEALIWCVLAAAIVILLAAGCATAPVKVLDPTTDPVRLPKGTNFTAVVDGYFVPDATMLRILDRLSERDIWGTNAP